MSHGISRGLSSGIGGAVVIGIIIVAAIAAVAIGAYFITIRKRGEKTAGLSPSQKETLRNFETHVLSLLTQHGGCLTQQEIRTHLDLPVETVAQQLLLMEKEGVIDRKWLTDEYTFCVQKPARANGE